MNTKILSASIAIALTVGFGARLVVGDDAAAAVATRNEATVEQSAKGPWMHPEIAVVVKVPAKKNVTLASAESVSDESTADATTGATWEHPAITVVMKVPAKADVASAQEGSTASVRRPSRPRRLWNVGNGNTEIRRRQIVDERTNDREFRNGFHGASWRS